MKYLILILLFCSCNPLRHYQKVANDKFRNNAERTLLARAANQEFPNITDTPRVVNTGVDSSDYLAVAFAYNQLVDSLIAHNERDTATTLDRVIYKFRITDSLKIIKQFLQSYHPPAVIKTIVREVQVRNTAMENQLQTAVDNCRDENDKLSKQSASDKEAKQTAVATKWWLIAIVGLLAAGNIYQLLPKRV